MKFLVVILSFLLYIPSVWAWDLCFPNEDGIMLYYDIVDMDEWSCEVTFCPGNEYECDTLRIPGNLVLNRGNWDYGDPDTLLTVIGIGEDAFRYDEGDPETYNFTSEIGVVVLPYSINYIGNRAFMGSKLTRIVWPKGNEWFKSIGNYAFCKSDLSEITIPRTIMEIDRSAFANSGVTRVEFEEGNRFLTKIPESCFINCHALREVRISNSITEIAESAFKGCDLLITVHFGSGLKILGKSAFERCLSLAPPKLPHGLEFIRENCFLGHPYWTSFELPATIRDIGKYAFCFQYYNEKTGLRSLASLNIKNLYVNKQTTPYCVSEKALGDYTYWDEKERKYTRVIMDTNLIVPLGCIEEYATTWPWDRFDRSKISARNLSGIKTATVRESQPESVFSLDGRQIPKAKKGLSIIRYKDGTARKVLKK